MKNVYARFSVVQEDATPELKQVKRENFSETFDQMANRATGIQKWTFLGSMATMAVGLGKATYDYISTGSALSMGDGILIGCVGGIVSGLVGLSIWSNIKRDERQMAKQVARDITS